MILHSQIVEQAVDLHERGTFVKELVLARGELPIALVRKRLADPTALKAPKADLEASACARGTRGAVLLIHGYGQNRYAFHLPSRSMANHLARAGFDVFNIDLRGRGRSGHLGAGRPGGVLDFVRHDVPAALDEIEQLTGETGAFLIGHSLGGVVSYCVAVDHPTRVRGVISLGAPYHFTLGSRWLRHFGSAFLALDARMSLPNLPVPTRTYGRFVRATRRLVDSSFYPLPLRGFHGGNVEPTVLAEHMALAMDHGSIATLRGMFAWAREARQRRRGDVGLFGYARRFEQLDVPLLVIAGRHDDLAPPDSVRPAYEHSRSHDRRYRELPFGHADLLIGRDAPQACWPLVEQWLRRRSRSSHVQPQPADSAP